MSHLLRTAISERTDRRPETCAVVCEAGSLTYCELEADSSPQGAL